MAGNGIISASSVSRSIQKAGVGRRDPFIFGMSIILLLTVFIGFSLTLYLSAFRDLPPLPAHLHVHGAILTGWFVWLVVQTSLIKTNRVASGYPQTPDAVGVDQHCRPSARADISLARAGP
jgi:hypothetical protein